MMWCCGAPPAGDNIIVGSSAIVPAATTNAAGGFIGIIAEIVASIGAGYDEGATRICSWYLGAPKRPI